MRAILKAFEAASLYHGSQVRKHTKEPFVTHPVRVARLVEKHWLGFSHKFPSKKFFETDLVAAALLHDILEDTCLTMDKLSDMFSAKICLLVDGLTDKPSFGNRRIRSERNLKRILQCSPEVHFIKCCDILDNIESIAMFEYPFFKDVYSKEKLSFLNSIDDRIDLKHIVIDKINKLL